MGAKMKKTIEDIRQERDSIIQTEDQRVWAQIGIVELGRFGLYAWAMDNTNVCLDEIDRLNKQINKMRRCENCAHLRRYANGPACGILKTAKTFCESWELDDPEREQYC